MADEQFQTRGIRNGHFQKERRASGNVVTFDPPMISVALNRESRKGALILASGGFHVRLLRSGEEGLAKGHGTACSAGLVEMDCSISSIHAIGDHDLVIAQVSNVSTSDGHPVVYWRQGLHALRPQYDFVSSPSVFDKFIAAWEDGSLPKALWTHAGHVAVGAFYVVRHPSNAFERTRSGILRYNVAVGTENSHVSGYHETLPRFWADVLARFVKGIADPWEAAVKAVDKLGEDRDLHHLYYSFDVVRSPEARRAWIPPDLDGRTDVSCFALLARAQTDLIIELSEMTQSSKTPQFDFEIRECQAADFEKLLPQGGLTAVGVAEAESEFGDPNYLGAVAISGVGEAHELQRMPVFLAQGIKTVFPEFRVEEMLTDKAIPLYQHISHACEAILGPELAANEMLKPGWENNRYVKEFFARNTPVRKPIHGPLLLISGGADPEIPSALIATAVAQLCRQKDRALLIKYSGLNASAVIGDSVSEQISWIRARFAGHPAPSNCP